MAPCCAEPNQTRLASRGLLRRELTSGKGQRALCGAAPSVKPAARPDPPGPSALQSLGGDRHRSKWVTSGGPDGSEVNGLTLGPLRLLGQRCRQARGLLLGTRAFLSLLHKGKSLDLNRSVRVGPDLLHLDRRRLHEPTRT